MVAIVWLGSLFVYSGSLKLVEAVGDRIRAVQGYQLTPARVARIIGIALPYAELACGIAILVTPFARAGATVAGALGVVFALASGSALLRGIKTQCGCAGRGSDLVRPTTFVRAGLMIGVAFAVASSGTSLPAGIGAVALGIAVAPVGLLIARQRSGVHAHRQHAHVHRPLPVAETSGARS